MENPADPHTQEEPHNSNRDASREAPARHDTPPQVTKMYEVIYIKANNNQDALEHLKVGRGFHTMQKLESFFGKSRKHLYRGIYLIEPLDDEGNA